MTLQSDLKTWTTVLEAYSRACKEDNQKIFISSSQDPNINGGDKKVIVKSEIEL